MRPIKARLLLVLTAFLALASCRSSGELGNEPEQLIERSRITFQSMMSDNQYPGLVDLATRAKAIMIVPNITTLTIDALNSIPMGIREASYAMGATKWQTIYKVVLPAAKLGIVDAIVLGMGRAIGETMAVLMVVGNAPVIPDSIASPISTLTSQIALDMSYSSGLHRSALFGMGVVLFIISAALVGIVRLISKKKRG